MAIKTIHNVAGFIASCIYQTSLTFFFILNALSNMKFEIPEGHF